ncbi:MAG: hypothetical protein HOE48_21310, partial [Candidatus Latescibacteria bacterium]|nr:hypothetical protein [Candidatus Latescibacterota bacterium]
NEGVSQDVRDELSKRGHTVEVKEGAIAVPVMVYIDQENGKFYAAGDPMARRHAAGL